MNYKRIIENYERQLDYLISQKTDPAYIAFLGANLQRGKFKKSELTELKGYYSGLKVAREALQRIIAMEEEESEWQNDDWDDIK